MAMMILFALIQWGCFEFITGSARAQQNKKDMGKKLITAGFIGYIILSIAHWIDEILGSAPP